MTGYSRNFSVHSFLALKCAVRTPLDLFSSKHSRLTLQWLLDLLHDTQIDFSSEASQDTAYDDMKNIDKLFEKGPSNVHRENCVLAEIIFNEFCDWIKRTDKNDMKANLEHLNQLGIFVKTRVKNYNDNLPQDTVYYTLYATVVALCMMKILVEKVEPKEVGNECEGGREACVIYKRNLHWVRELRKSGTEQCFYHFKLEEMANFVLAES